MLLRNEDGAVIGPKELDSVPQAGNRYGHALVAPVASNVESVALASAARTATNSTPDIDNPNGKTLHVIIDASAAAATPSVVPKIEGKDPISGNYYTVLTGAAITGVSTTVLKVGPGITPAANAAAADMVPRTFRVTMTHADADSLTYSIAVVLGG